MININLEINILIINEEIAKEGIYDILDFFFRIKEIIKEVNDNNAPYKAIKGFTLCDELPKNSSHKIIRNK